ncbi:MAG: WD40 repeat domain-containing protein [Kistimonas sp.]|nr:WD40 repeat domain-containing protein [Kistimonas sp.]
MHTSYAQLPQKRQAPVCDDSMPCPSSSSSSPEPRPQLAGRELTSAPGESLLPPLSRRHKAEDCNSQPFSCARFNASIAPWLDRFDPDQTKALERCTDLETFPTLVRTAVGTQLRQAARLHLEERECFMQPGGVTTCVGPGRYELFEYCVERNSNSLYVRNDDEDWAEGASRARGCSSPDQSRLVTIWQEHAFIHRAGEDGSWNQVAQSCHGEPVHCAQWSPCSQFLVTQSEETIKVWSERHADHWEQVISQPCNRFTHFTGFSPDSRTFVVDTRGIHSWWRQEDGSWTAAPSLTLSGMMSHIAFSKDSRKLALSLCGDIGVKIFSRSLQGGWTPDGELVPDPQPGHPSDLSERHASTKAGRVEGMAFNIHGQLAVGRDITRLEKDDDSQLDANDSHMSLALWDLSSSPWKQQSRIVASAKTCAKHDWMQWGGSTSCGGLSHLFFSADGRFLIAEDDCKRVKAWCLVPELARDRSDRQ